MFNPLKMNLPLFTSFHQGLERLSLFHKNTGGDTISEVSNMAAVLKFADWVRITPKLLGGIFILERSLGVWNFQHFSS